MKKIWHIIKDIFVTLIVILAVCMVIFTMISITTFNNAERSIFGYKALVVLTDSMSATDFQAGDLVIVKEISNPDTLEVGDIISFRSTNIEHYYEIVTHKIREKVITENGSPGFITYGTTTGVNDQDIVTYENIIGKYCKTYPKVGVFFQFLKTTKGYIICILIPFLILILIQAINCARLFMKYRKETLDDINIEKVKIEAAKEENLRMKEELDKESMKAREMQEEIDRLKEKLKAKKKKTTTKKTTTKKTTTKKETTKTLKVEKKEEPVIDNNDLTIDSETPVKRKRVRRSPKKKKKAANITENAQMEKK